MAAAFLGALSGGFAPFLLSSDVLLGKRMMVLYSHQILPNTSDDARNVAGPSSS
jgi:hypothetical protein